MNKPDKILSIFGLFVLFAASLYAQHSFFVSPSGSDRNPGTKEKPFQTIQRAQKAVRVLDREKGKNAIVYLRGGIYALQETLVFGSQDGGSEGFKVTYCNYPGEKPMISGGIRVNEWLPHENGIFQARVNADAIRCLYVNGRPAVRARTPNTGTYNRLSVWNIEDKLIYIRSEDLPVWEPDETVEMSIQLRWSGSICRIASARTNEQEEYSPGASAILTLQEPERELLFERDYPQKRTNQSFHFENSIRFLDDFAEFYFDKNTETLYYMPRPGEDMGTSKVIVPGLETLVRVKGTPDDPVTNLCFQGLTFAHSGWNGPDETGYLGLEYGQYTTTDTRCVSRPPAMFLVEAATGLRIERNVFKNAGATGLDLHFGTDRCVIAGNVFHHVAANGISHSKFSDPDVFIGDPYMPKDEREICRNDSIKNNYLYNVGSVYLGSVGIACGYPRSLTIAHNELCYMPGAAIAVGWGWTFEANAMENNHIVHNNIHHVMLRLEDQGAIKLLSRQPNSLLEGNWVHDIQLSEWATDQNCPMIYLDEATGGYLIKNNATQDPVHESFKFHNVGRNIIQDCCQGYNKEIHMNAGLQQEYKDIIAIY